MIEPASPWNFGLILQDGNPAKSFEVVTNPIGKYPFGDRGDLIYNATSGSFDTLRQDPPLMLKAKGKLLPGWVMDGANAAAPPYSPLAADASVPVTDLLLVPYASAKLRVSEIPLIK
jgi:hypothetical protein